MADAESSIRIPVEADLSAFSGALDDLSRQSKQFASVFTGTMRSAITSGRSFEDTLRSMALKLSTVALTAGLKPLESALGSALQSVVGAGANALPSLTGGGVTPFAKGGVVASPTFFQSGGGTGVMGEAGAEAILPLARGADGRLGVRDASAGSAPMQVTFNIATPDVAGFQRSQTQISAMLARTVGRGRRGL